MKKALFENFGVIIFIILLLAILLLGIIIFKVEYKKLRKKYNKAHKVCCTKGRDRKIFFSGDPFAMSHLKIGSSQP